MIKLSNTHQVQLMGKLVAPGLLVTVARFKNPAYGRHRISRLMQIVAQIFLFPLASKKELITFLDFFGGGGCVQFGTPPRFRAPCEGKGCSAPVHEQGTLRTGKGHFFTKV